MRSRLLPHLLFWAVLWPAASALAASMDVAERQIYPFRLAIGLSGLGTLVLLPELLLSVVLLTAASVVAFGAPSERPLPFRFRLAEPFLLLVAVLAAASARFPALVHHPYLLPLRGLPTGVVLAGLALFAFLLLFARAREETGPGRRAALVLGPLGLALGLALLGGASPPASSRGPRDSVLLVGLDSVWVDDLAAGRLRELAATGARSYRKAVAPALITNGVWASVLLGEAADRHRVLLGLQDWSIGDRQDALPLRARAAGLETVAVFPNRSTTWIGARGGFDSDEGGALGWRQMATAWVKDGGVVLPLLLPLLPEVPFAATPRNQADTYTYDLETDLARVVGREGRAKFVAAHLTYLHENRYPSFPEMGSEERLRVLRAPAGRVFDDSFNWRHRDDPASPIALRPFKWARLQEALASALVSSGVLEPASGNVVVLFADHGPRYGLSQETFRDRRFWHVPLVAWGDRSDLPLDEPVSLAEIGRITGLTAPRAERVPAAVSFADVTISDWKEMEGGTRPLRDGSVALPADVVGRIVDRAERYEPGEADFGPETAGPASDPRPEAQEAPSGRPREENRERASEARAASGRTEATTSGAAKR